MQRRHSSNGTSLFDFVCVLYDLTAVDVNFNDTLFTAVYQRGVHRIHLPGVESDRVLFNEQHHTEHRQAKALRISLSKWHRCINMSWHQWVCAYGRIAWGWNESQTWLTLRQFSGELSRAEINVVATGRNDRFYLQGYCDVFLKCRAVDTEGPLARLKNLLFNKETLSSVAQWITVSANVLFNRCFFTIIVYYLF